MSLSRAMESEQGRLAGWAVQEVVTVLAERVCDVVKEDSEPRARARVIETPLQAGQPVSRRVDPYYDPGATLERWYETYGAAGISSSACTSAAQRSALGGAPYRH